MAKKASLVFGVVFLVVGLLGFIPNPIVGEESLFHTDLIHNLTHLISGVIFLFIALKAEEKSSKALKVFGIIYLVLAVVGSMTISFNDSGRVLGLVGMNGPDHILHLILGVILVALGASSSRSVSGNVTENISEGI